MGSDPLIEGIAGASISAFFCFGGWWEAGKIAGQVRNPSRNLPIAFSGGVLIVTAIYLLVSFAFVAVIPMEQIQSNTAFVAQFGQALFGTAGGRVLSSCVVLSVLGGLMVVSMAVPRVTYALARGEAGDEGKGILGAFARLHPRFGTPANGVLLQTGMALLVLSLGAFDRILALYYFFRSRLSSAHRGNPVSYYYAGDPLVVSPAPIIFIAGSGVLSLMLLLHNLGPSILGAVVILDGLPARWLLTRGTNTAPVTAAESSLT